MSKKKPIIVHASIKTIRVERLLVVIRYSDVYVRSYIGDFTFRELRFTFSQPPHSSTC